MGQGGLGHVFRTDLLLLRVSVGAPIVRDTTDPVQLRTLEDALYSIAEALRAQYDASQAYIRSQAHAGWTLLRSRSSREFSSNPPKSLGEGTI